MYRDVHESRTTWWNMDHDVDRARHGRRHFAQRSTRRNRKSYRSSTNQFDRHLQCERVGDCGRNDAICERKRDSYICSGELPTTSTLTSDCRSEHVDLRRMHRQLQRMHDSRDPPVAIHRIELLHFYIESAKQLIDQRIDFHLK